MPWRSRASIGKMRHLLGLSVKALSARQGSGNSPEDRLPVLRPSSQYSLVACRPVIRIHPEPEGPLRHTQPYARRRRRVEKAGQAANSNSGSGRALGRGQRQEPYPLQKGSGSRPNRSGRRRSAVVRNRPRIRWGRRKTPAPAGSPTAADGRRIECSLSRPPPTARQPARPARCGRGHGAPTPPPVITEEMEPRRGDQSGQSLQQFQRRQQEMAGPIRPRRFEREGKRVGIENAQAPSRQGRPGHVAAQAFEPPPVRACDPRCRMQRKTARSKAQGPPYAPRWPDLQDPAQGWPARAPVAVIPRTEAAVRAACTGSLTAIPAAHHAQKHRQYGRDPLAVPGEAVAHLVRKAEHPLAPPAPGASRRRPGGPPHRGRPPATTSSSRIATSPTPST